tara:strand:- start:7556 stop:8134 length:579 start_codon:yes stop_codon:yes gene_type:complete
MPEQIHFLRALLRNHGRVGSVAPSSEELAAIMVEWLNWEKLETVVEYGPGTGVFTEAISKRLLPNTHFFAIERDPHLASLTRKRCPEIRVIEDCASQVRQLCHKAGIKKIDAILCGLPWAAFSPELQDQLLHAMFEVLPPGGKFATFAYWQGLALPSGQRFRRLLYENFAVVEQSRTAWRNLPPAFVYQCER